MAETNGLEPTPDGQEPTGTEGQGTTTVEGAEGNTPLAQETSESFDAEYVKKLRSEAAEYRRKLRELETRVKEEDDKKLSETERMQRKLADLEKEAEQLKRDRQERTVRYETMLAASKLNIVDPDAAFRLMDASALEFDENGSPTNMEKVLQGLIKTRPYLVKQVQNSDINAGEGRGAGNGAGQISDEALQEFAARMGLDPKYVRKEDFKPFRNG